MVIYTTALGLYGDHFLPFLTFKMVKSPNKGNQRKDAGNSFERFRASMVTFRWGGNKTLLHFKDKTNDSFSARSIFLFSFCSIFVGAFLPSSPFRDVVAIIATEGNKI